MKYELTVVLISIFLITNDVEHLLIVSWSFVCFLDQCISPLFILSLLICLFVIELHKLFMYSRFKYLTGYMVCKYFSHFVSCFFTSW